MWVQPLGWKDPLENRMATHSRILAWSIPWTEEPGGLQSLGLQSRTRLKVTEHTALAAKVGALRIDERLTGSRVTGL